MFTEWNWLIEFGFGMLLAYYCISPRLRRFVARLIEKFGHTEREVTPRQSPIDVEKPVTISDLFHVSQADIDRVKKSHILVSDEQLAKWLQNNPDLRKVNSGGK